MSAVNVHFQLCVYMCKMERGGERLRTTEGVCACVY
jgi:hypothetical protein